MRIVLRPGLAVFMLLSWGCAAGCCISPHRTGTAGHKHPQLPAEQAAAELFAESPEPAPETEDAMPLPQSMPLACSGGMPGPGSHSTAGCCTACPDPQIRPPEYAPA